MLWCASILEPHRLLCCFIKSLGPPSQVAVMAVLVPAVMTGLVSPALLGGEKGLQTKPA
jgi:hypothetical protein